MKCWAVGRQKLILPVKENQSKIPRENDTGPDF